MNRKQCTDSVIMIRPKNFGFNTETAASNSFQSKNESLSATDIKKLAKIEFDNFANELISKGIHVRIIEDSDDPAKPDAVFPNNWFSTHQENSLVTYPMFSKIRREERRDEVISEIINDRKIKRYKFEIYEDKAQYLEGTGSLVLDRKNKIAYACRSNRTDLGLLNSFGILMGYQTVVLNATDIQGLPIYHTNVLMMVGEKIVVVCFETISDPDERIKLKNRFEQTGHEILEISYQQMNAFAGNMIQLENNIGNKHIILSRTAHNALNAEQISTLKMHGDLIIGQINTIETYGGGSVRCMIAEDFLT